MNKAINTTHEYQSEERIDETATERISRIEGLKPEINNLLHVALRDDHTISEADALSWTILDILMNPDTYLIARQQK